MRTNALDHTPPTRRAGDRRDRAVTTAPDEAPVKARSARRGLLGLLALGTLLGAAAVTLAVRTWQVGTGLGPALFPVEDIVELAAVALGTAVAGRVAVHSLVALAWVLATRSGMRWSAGERTVARHAPAVVRRLALAATGAGVGLALVAPTALALPASPRVPPAAESGAAAVLELGWQPTVHQAPQEVRADRSDLAGASRRTGAEHDRTVVVEPGDTLWAIAAEELATGRAGAGDAAGVADATERASAAQVADAVRRWHQSNRDVLGADPDLIRPGTVLHAP